MWGREIHGINPIDPAPLVADDDGPESDDRT
jgi:hypothetical protein